MKVIAGFAIVFLFVVGCGSAYTKEKDLRALIEDASIFLVFDWEKVENAVEKIKNLPNPEKPLWDFVENGEVTPPLRAEDVFTVLHRANLVGEYSLARSREILEAQLDQMLDPFADFTEAELARDSSFGFGTPTGVRAQEVLRNISIVVGSFGVLAGNGSSSDIPLLSR